MILENKNSKIQSDDKGKDKDCRKSSKNPNQHLIPEKRFREIMVLAPEIEARESDWDKEKGFCQKGYCFDGVSWIKILIYPDKACPRSVRL